MTSWVAQHYALGTRQIRIDLSGRGQQTQPLLRDVAINILLHEMVHASLAKYGCYASVYGEECTDVVHCRWPGTQKIGTRLHGRVFVWLATAVQEAAVQLLSFSADVDLLGAASVDIGKGGVRLSKHHIDNCFSGAECREGW